MAGLSELNRPRRSMMDPQQQFKYRAFISYSHSDEEWAKWLHKSLET